MKVFRVSELNAYINKVLKMDYLLSQVAVHGEISSVNQYPSGHLYITIKDDEAQLSGIMYKWQVGQLSFTPEIGMQVELNGKISIYEPGGRLQIVINSMNTYGLGKLYEKFIKLKNELESKGYFDPAKKKKLPKYPKRVGVVTSLKAAALQDFLKVLNRRNPGIEIIIAPSLVQGAHASKDLIQAFTALDKIEDLDLIVITRGGGSLEDLWCFNDRELIEVIASRKHPVVSAVGHEIDYTLVDLVSDWRSPTPSAAAEEISQDINELSQYLDQKYLELKAIITNFIREKIHSLEKSYILLNNNGPEAYITKQRLNIDKNSTYLNHRIYEYLNNKKDELRKVRQKVEKFQIQRQILDQRMLLNTQKIKMNDQIKCIIEDHKLQLKELYDRLQFSLENKTKQAIFNESGDIIYLANQVEPDENLSIEFIDGTIHTKVKSIERIKE